MDFHLGMDNVHEFSRKDFDEVVFSESYLERFKAKDGVARLKGLRDDVAKSIAEHIKENNVELLKQLGRDRDLKVDVLEMKDRVDSLSLVMQKIDGEAGVVYRQLKDDTVRLRNIHKISTMLEEMNRFVLLVSQLRKVLGDCLVNKEFKLSARDLSQAAKLLRDVKVIMGSGKLDGIRMVECENEWLSQSMAWVLTRAEATLFRAAQEDKLQNELRHILVALFNFDALPQCVNKLLRWIIRKVSDEARVVFDGLATDNASDMMQAKTAKYHRSVDQTVSDKKAPGSQDSRNELADTISSSSNFTSKQELPAQAALWKRIKRIELVIMLWSTRVQKLQKLLLKYQDLFEHSTNKEHAEDSTGKVKEEILQVESLYDKFWIDLVNTLHGEIERAFRAYPFIREVLGAQEYPRIRAMFIRIPANLRKNWRMESPKSIEDESHGLLRALQPLHEVFLAQSHHRLREAVRLMFSEALDDELDSMKHLPTFDKIATFANAILKELTSSVNDRNLASALARGAGNAITVFTRRIEPMIDRSKDALRLELPIHIDDKYIHSEKVEELLTIAQENNLAILRLVSELRRRILDMPASLASSSSISDSQWTEAVSGALQSGIDRLSEIVNLILRPFMLEICGKIEGMVPAIHEFDYSSESNEETGAFLGERILKVIAFFKRFYISKFPAEEPEVLSLTRSLRERIVAVFNRHVCLVRPLGLNGHLRLIDELAHFDLAVRELSTNEMENAVFESCAAYKEMRCLGRLMLVDTNDCGLATKEYLKSANAREVRVTNLWHAAFSRAPSELVSPFEVGVRISDQRLSSYCKALDNIQSSILDVPDILAIQFTVEEPQEVLDFAWAKIQGSMDLYVDLDDDSKTQCSQLKFLQNLSTLR